MESVIIDMVNVTRCFRCPYWHNFARREDGSVSPLDMGFCTHYSIVKDSTGYCDIGTKGVNHE